MIHLKFEGGASGPDILLGPAPWFRVGGNFIREGPDGIIVAVSGTCLGSAIAETCEVFL